MMTHMVRRVVTGHNSAGQSVVVSDSNLRPLPFGTRGGAVHLVWGRDDVAHFPDTGEQPRWRLPSPPPGGSRLTVFELSPGDSKEFDDFVMDSMGDFADQDRPGLHAAPTLDFDIVLEGTVGLELEDGEVTLGPGDTVVQNGTPHRWHNRGSTMARIAAVAVGAEHDNYPPPQV
jgi:mannose-6-phosphate isomerase-like protein (cupin superfamily)